MVSKMKKTATVFEWIGMSLLALMAVYALSQSGFAAAILFLAGAAFIAPFPFAKKLRSRIKINRITSAILAVILFVFGSVLTPSTEIKSDTENTSSISSTTSYVTSSALQKTESESKTVSDSAASSQSIKRDSVGSGKATAVDVSGIPEYSGKPYTVINNNIPNFSADELKSSGYEKYSNLDSLGRTKTAIASVGRDTMPKQGEMRGSISNIKPSGWKQAKYDSVNGGWLYNRCHLIGWQLSAENDNARNLITGTKYLNVDGMLPFENMVADYIKETNNHVAYRITPVYIGNNLLASGVQMEAYSVEDNGEGICFNIYCYNVQPNVTINYSTGASSAAAAVKPSGTAAAKPSVSVNTAPQVQTAPVQETNNTVYITKTGKKYHSRTDCPGLSNAKEIIPVELSDAQTKNLGPCSKCH